ncbi:hypothetical protein GCM10028791_33340 [Echinicola sediminis]
MWEILKGSELTIRGTTNISNFHCDTGIYLSEDKIYKTVLPNGKVSWSGIIRVSAGDFDCANKIMTKDFQQVILVDRYPFVIMTFIDMYEGDKMDSILTGRAMVTLAGRSKRIVLTCRMEKVKDGVIVLTGSHIFLFSDFALDPPKKFFGAVKVNNEVTVDFKILLKSQKSISIPIR